MGEAGEEVEEDKVDEGCLQTWEPLRQCLAAFVEELVRARVSRHTGGCQA
jgi:hypothetical protein